MFDLKEFTTDAFETAQPFIPVLPNGETDESLQIFIKSVKSKEAKEHAEKTMRKDRIAAYDAQKQDHAYIPKLKSIEENNIVYACLLVDRFDGVKIDGEKLESTPENIRMLMEKCDWLREQVIKKAQDEKLFFPS